MRESSGTKAELIAEISDLKQKIQKLEKSEAKRKQAEKALKESELKYRSLIECSSDAIFCVDEKGQYKFANSLFASTFGKTPDYFIGKTFWDVYPKEHADYRYEATKRVFSTGKSESLEVEVPLPDKTLYFYATANPIKDKKGKVILTLTHATDITEHKRAEEALKESEIKYRELVENSPDAIAIYVEGKIVYVNRECLHLMAAASSAELIGKSVIQFVHPDYRALVIERMKKVANERAVLPLTEEKFLRLDGSEVEVEVKAMPIGFENKLAVQLIVRDITERKRAEATLRVSEENFRRSLDESPLGGRIVTTDGETIYANRAILDIYGYDSIDELRITPVEKRYTPVSYAEFLIRRDKRKRGDYVPSEYTIDIIRKNGEVRHLQAHRKEILWNGEKQDQVVYQDITERHKLEKALRLITDNMTDIICVTDLQGVYLYISPSHVNVLGYKPGKGVGKSAFEIVHPDDVEHISSVFSEGLVNKNPARAEYRIKHAQGHYVWVETIGDLLRDDQGEVTGVILSSRNISDRKAAEEELSRSTEKFKFLAENMADVVFTLDINLATTYVSPSIERMLGFTPEERMAQKLDQQLTPKSQKLAGEVLLAELGREKENNADPDRSVTLELEDYHKDGSIKHLVTYLRGIRNSEGKLTGFYGSHHDVTDRKLAEEALRESEERYRTLVENASDIIFRADNTGHFTFVNPAALRITGYEEEEIMGMQYQALIHPDRRDEAIKFFSRQFVKRLQNAYSEYPIITKDGHEVWLGQNTQLIVEDGNVTGFQSVSRDITERKRTEDALKESEEKFRSAVEKSLTGIAIVDDAFRYTYVNEEFSNMAGYMEQEILCKNFTFLLAEESKMLAAERYQRRQRGEDVPAQYEISFLRKNGEKRIGEVRSAVYLDSSGKVNSLIQVIDITERKQAEEEKRILGERLQQADKMEAIGTLAGGIAHDFNNLLMGIQGYASLTLLDLDPSHPHYERLKRIEEHVQSGADLTRQLLGFARGGRYEVKPTDMNEIIEKTSSMFGRTKKEISIQRKSGKDLESVEVDREQMEQAFLNLYVNAWQAMPGGGELYLETQNILLNDEQALFYSVKPGKHVKITITDTGTGMDEKTRERIFDPFFTTKDMGRGTGLGLATVYGIIKGHGGMITVHSELGQGTTFTIHLPASEKKVVKEETQNREIVAGTETILLVDDEKMVMEVNKELLESMGYKVYAAGSGQEAIAVYMGKRNEIDLVILDMIMPGMSGGETFDRLREINPNVKVLLSSGYSLTGKAQEIMNRGCNGFLQKPFQLEQLSGKVREMLD